MQSNVKVNYAIETEPMPPPIECKGKHIAQRTGKINALMEEGIQNLGKADTGKTFPSDSSRTTIIRNSFSASPFSSYSLLSYSSSKTQLPAYYSPTSTPA
jgi:hypothetical protein